MKNRVFVTRRIPPEGLAVLRDHGFAVELNPEDRPMTKLEIIGSLNGVDALLTQLVDPVDREVIEAGKSLRVIATYAAGYDNIDVSAAVERGIVVTNTPRVLTEATAEMAWSLLLSAARRVAEGDRLTRSAGFQGWAPLFHLGQGVSGKVLGIVGAGRIGTAVARMSRGFGMKILYWGRTRNVEIEQELGGRKVELTDLLKESDFVSLHVPLNAGTRYLIGEKELALMKPTSVLVNTARGPVIDEAALVLALRGGRPFAAGLDVYEKEPALTPGLADLPNVVLAPHAGSATVETRARMAVLAAENIAAVLEGRPPLTPVGG
jgi:glyoxylate reductase